MRDPIGGQQRVERIDTLQAMHQQIGEHGDPVATNQLGGCLGEQRQRPWTGSAGVAGQRRGGRLDRKTGDVGGDEQVAR